MHLVLWAFMPSTPVALRPLKPPKAGDGHGLFFCSVLEALNTTEVNASWQFAITKGQFAAFVEATGHQTDAESDEKGGYGYDGKDFKQAKEYTWKNTGWEQTDRHPVVNVSHNDAVAYCEWASKATGVF